MELLPQFRVNFTFPFSHADVNYMGPLFVRNVFCNKDKTLHKVFLVVYDELLTVICKIESVVNSRLLCYVYDDSIEEVITPSHLLLGRRVLTKFNSDFNKNNMDCDALSRRAHYLQTLVDHYWNRWRRE